MVYTANPNAQITVIEAASSSYEDLFNAITLATTGSIILNNKKYTVKPAQIISMSWGSQEFSGQNSLDSYFNYKNICFCASSGDENYVNYPASSPNVIAVGGTTLTLNNDNTKSEKTWSSAGCGISTYTPLPVYQSTFKTSKVNNRIIPDVSCVANPNTGVRVYSNGSWKIYGGTSVSCPLFAGMLSLANQKRLDSGKSTLISSSILNKYMIQDYIYKKVYPNTKLYPNIFNDITIGVEFAAKYVHL
jgi:subtilase family serine protease